ncbi:MAG: hypothetical protein HMLKMBBP_01745 [Planctomycetes bacterium]|nr:hypothetical protein [Planctomycetota bacterium]
MQDHPAESSRPSNLREKRQRRTVETFRVSAAGFRHVFSGHFPDRHEDVEAVAYHLGKVEALLPTTREAIRLARYPGAGNRNPKRMALGLVENVSVLESNLKQARHALERLARSHRGHGAGASRKTAAAAKQSPRRPAKPKTAAKRSRKPSASKRAK